MSTIGCSSSAAKMSRRTGIHQPGQKILVEDGKWISTEELKRSFLIDGLNYFNAKRPAKDRIH